MYGTSDLSCVFFSVTTYQTLCAYALYTYCMICLSKVLQHVPEAFIRMQILKNTGSSAIAVPYTLAISSPNYALITGSAWNWGASGSANGGTLSGPVTQVHLPV